MCYAALPGDVVRFRSFPCSDLLRVICQYGSDDTRPLLRQKHLLRGQTLTPPERPDPPKPKVKQKQSLGKSYPNKDFFLSQNLSLSNLCPGQPENWAGFARIIVI